MKFYSFLTVLSYMVLLVAPTPASFPSNPSQTVAATEHGKPLPKPYKGQGKRELKG
ncbi:hypothetical protein [Nostoc sp. C052]|uniref:hypothetical protein n=1 Tax=Nostoc sp. C052 TaxID=2576902 RepID=UPI0015C2C51A|nr:hypothetical protein [Nostoc sp. C052]